MEAAEIAGEEAGRELPKENRTDMPDVSRSDSTRSDVSRPRVSFNRNVHVKRISAPKTANAYSLSSDGTSLVPTSIRRERPMTKKEMTKEAQAVLKQVDKVSCTATTNVKLEEEKPKPKKKKKNSFSFLKKPEKHEKSKNSSSDVDSGSSQEYRIYRVNEPTDKNDPPRNDVGNGRRWNEEENEKKKIKIKVYDFMSLDRKRLKREKKRENLDYLSLEKNNEALEKMRKEKSNKTLVSTVFDRGEQNNRKPTSPQPQPPPPIFIPTEEKENAMEMTEEITGKKKQLSPIIEIPGMDYVDCERGNNVDKLIKKLTEKKPGKLTVAPGKTETKEPTNDVCHNDNRPFSYTNVDKSDLPLKSDGKNKLEDLGESKEDSKSNSPTCDVIYAQVFVGGRDGNIDGKPTVNERVASNEVGRAFVGEESNQSQVGSNYKFETSGNDDFCERVTVNSEEILRKEESDSFKMPSFELYEDSQRRGGEEIFKRKIIERDHTSPGSVREEHIRVIKVATNYNGTKSSGGGGFGDDQTPSDLHDLSIRREILLSRSQSQAKERFNSLRRLHEPARIRRHVSNLNGIRQGEKPSGIEPIRSESFGKEPSRREPARSDSFRKEPSRREPSRSDSFRKEPSRREPSRSDSFRKEPPRREPSRSDSFRKESPRREPSRSETLRKETLKRETTRIDARHQEDDRESPKREQPSRTEARHHQQDDVRVNEKTGTNFKRIPKDPEPSESNSRKPIVETVESTLRKKRESKTGGEIKEKEEKWKNSNKFHVIKTDDDDDNNLLRKLTRLGKSKSFLDEKPKSKKKEKMKFFFKKKKDGKSSESEEDPLSARYVEYRGSDVDLSDRSGDSSPRRTTAVRTESSTLKNSYAGKKQSPTSNSYDSMGTLTRIKNDKNKDSNGRKSPNKQEKLGKQKKVHDLSTEPANHTKSANLRFFGDTDQESTANESILAESKIKYGHYKSEKLTDSDEDQLIIPSRSDSRMTSSTLKGSSTGKYKTKYDLDNPNYGLKQMNHGLGLTSNKSENYSSNLSESSTLKNDTYDYNGVKYGPRVQRNASSVTNATKQGTKEKLRNLRSTPAITLTTPEESLSRRVKSHGNLYSQEDRKGGRRRLYDSSAESATEGDSSQHSSKSMIYLHAATVGDIPGPRNVYKSERRSQSREEISSIGENGTISPPAKKTLSRSFSVLAPWRPRHNKEDRTLHYDSVDYNRGKPPTGVGKIKRSSSKDRKSNELRFNTIGKENRRRKDLVR